MSLYHLSVTLHLVAALFWLGGMFVLGLVGAPVLRQVEPPAMRVALFQDLGLRFRNSGWVAIGILLLTGVANLGFRGVLRWGVLTAPHFWTTPFGRALGWKLIAVLAMISASAIHDFVLGPMASRLRPGSPEAERARRWAALLARANAFIGILVVLLAVRLARGG